MWIAACAGAVWGAVFLLAADPAALGGFLALGLAAAIVVGIAVRLVRAPRGRSGI